MTLRPPSSTLFPYTTLFRSDVRRPLVRAARRLACQGQAGRAAPVLVHERARQRVAAGLLHLRQERLGRDSLEPVPDRKSTRLNSSHSQISYAVFCLKKKN